MDIKIVEKVKLLKLEGKTYKEISDLLNITPEQARYYNLFVDIDAYAKAEKEIKKQEEKICELIKTSNNINQVCRKLGQKGTNTQYAKIQKIIDKYNIDTSHFCVIVGDKRMQKIDLKEILVQNSHYQSSKLIKKLLNEGLKEKKCECCGLTEWKGKEIPLELHHINGIHSDNRLENLQILCRNCHGITDNYCGKNIKKRTLPLKILPKKQVCKYCGKEFETTKNAYFCCKEHYYAYLKENHIYTANTSKCPNKDTLIQDFVELKNFTQVAKKYDVSDKTITKWCKKLGLPTHINGIKEMINNYKN